MPYFRLETNIPQEKIPKDFPNTLCKLLSTTLGKPISVSNFPVLHVCLYQRSVLTALRNAPPISIPKDLETN